MKNQVLFLFFTLSLFNSAQAQTEKTKPSWSSGIFGNLYGGYAIFSQPLVDEGIAAPYASIAQSGVLAGMSGGIIFKNRFGLVGVISGFSSQNIAQDLETVLAAQNPDYFVQYQTVSFRKNRTVSHFSAGISYAFPRKRWCFQPEILLGLTEVTTNSAQVSLKKSGSHEAIQLDYTPTRWDKRSPTLTLGCRTTWHVGGYFGLFANAQLLALRHKIEFRERRTTLIDLSSEISTASYQKTSLGAALSLGIFLQIIRFDD